MIVNAEKRVKRLYINQGILLIVSIYCSVSDHVIQLSKSKYAKFAVKAMMRLG